MAAPATNSKALTRDELEQLVERESNRLFGKSAKRAFELLDAGKLKNSPATEELRMLRQLLETS